jgi:hypothetical protein
MRVRVSFVFVGLALLALWAGAGGNGPAVAFSLLEYIEYLPAGYNPALSYPLVVLDVAGVGRP